MKNCKIRILTLNCTGRWNTFCEKKNKRCIVNTLSVRQLVSALRSVNHKGLHQGWTQASLYLRITSGLNTNLTLSPSYSFHKSSYHMSCFLSLFIFRGYSTREPAFSRVTYFILRAYPRTGVSHSQHRKKSEKVLEKKKSVTSIYTLAVKNNCKIRILTVNCIARLNTLWGEKKTAAY